MGVSGYFGTDAQKRLQRKSDRLTPWIMRTPGACLTGRVLCSDDPARLGWDVIHEHLREDGAFGFRWMDAAALENIRHHTKALDVSIHQWDGYFCEAQGLREAMKDLLTQELPPGMSVRVADADSVSMLQAFYAANGISPLSASVLLGTICPARSILICDEDNNIAAAGFVGMMQNKHSPLHDCAWAGLIAADPGCRGKGLGRRATCEVIKIALDELGADNVMAFAAPENHASRGMLMGCGLRETPYASYVATLSSARFSV